MKGQARCGLTGVVVVTLGCCFTPAAARASEAHLVPGIEQLYRLDCLGVFRESVKVASVSSYDRTGGNNDGFGGQYSFVRKEKDGLVLADVQGPGVIYRIWTPTPTDDSTPKSETRWSRGCRRKSNVARRRSTPTKTAGSAPTK